MSEQIRREFKLNFPIQKVKKALEDTCRTSTGSYQIKDKNEAFNSYSISLVKMLTVLPITIGLNNASETETMFSLSAVPGPQLSRNPTFAAEIIDDFLSKMSDFLTGKLIVKPQTPQQQAQEKKNQNAAIVGLLIGISIVAIIAYFIFR